MTFYLPDSYYDPPEPSPSDVLEAAEYDTDQLVEEWAHFAEVEVYMSAALTRADEPVFTISTVRKDGELLFGGPLGTDAQFDTIEDAREWLTERFPLDTEEEDF